MHEDTNTLKITTVARNPITPAYCLAKLNLASSHRYGLFSDESTGIPAPHASYLDAHGSTVNWPLRGVEHAFKSSYYLLRAYGSACQGIQPGSAFEQFAAQERLFLRRVPQQLGKRFCLPAE
jgi:hypothetical protein